MMTWKPRLEGIWTPMPVKFLRRLSVGLCALSSPPKKMTAPPTAAVATLAATFTSVVSTLAPSRSSAPASPASPGPPRTRPTKCPWCFARASRRETSRPPTMEKYLSRRSTAPATRQEASRPSEDATPTSNCADRKSAAAAAQRAPPRQSAQSHALGIPPPPRRCIPPTSGHARALPTDRRAGRAGTVGVRPPASAQRDQTKISSRRRRRRVDRTTTEVRRDRGVRGSYGPCSSPPPSYSSSKPYQSISRCVPLRCGLRRA
mmetsp:Transcript_8031/g.27810  ORF Transcript_8031/g.27810 Transcript_8031/m.27810 type:complete len:261 (+) Transcript_8031:643-1425(+)